MKSTLKATYISGGDSVIKIVIPKEIFDQDDPDDVRDKHLVDIVRSIKTGPHDLFEVKSAFHDDESGVFVETIGAIDRGKTLSTLKYYLQNRYVPYDTFLAMQQAKNDPASFEYAKAFPGRELYLKIEQFFDGLEDLVQVL